ncbi:MAG: flagellar biosynthesis protein FlgB [Acidimicrobiia bacterium]|nr:flagellar biosynthesis protein FlgB [Acidimicrobiia bacterium]
MIGDVTGQYLKVALAGLSAQRQAFVDNLANVETPGYRAARVDFESSLRRAAQSGSDAPGLEATETRSTAPTRLNGNNVAVDEELLSMTDNGLRQQLVVESLNARYRLLRTAITGQ